MGGVGRREGGAEDGALALAGAVGVLELRGGSGGEVGGHDKRKRIIKQIIAGWRGVLRRGNGVGQRERRIKRQDGRMAQRYLGARGWERKARNATSETHQKSYACPRDPENRARQHAALR